MSNKFKHAILLGLIAFALAGCAEEATVPVTETTPTSAATTAATAAAADAEPVYRDLGGKTYTIASWFEQTEPEVKRSAQEEALWEFRHEVMENNNFQFEEIIMGKWNTTLELLSTSTLAGDPAAEIFHLASAFARPAIDNGLVYDLTTLDSIDLDHWKWDDIAKDVTTVGDSIYGVLPDQTPRNFLFFNKRLLAEAGIESEQLYEWQANGEWTWEKFEEVANQVTRDKDNDGISDTYAIETTGLLYTAAVISNGSRMVSKDENGKLHNDIFEPEVIAALEWADQFLKKDFDTHTAHWDGSDEMFITGGVAFYYGDSNKVSFFQDMEDDYGLLLFPKGPDADKYYAGGNAEVWMIPSTYTKEEAENIAFAMDMWASQAPGYDDEDDWMLAEYKRYRDAESVDQTLAYAKEPGNMVMDYRELLSGAGTNPLTQAMMYKGATVMEAVESFAGTIDAAVAKANGETIVK
ncbi:ABC transporter substrate-binding protein [Candidatus Epulonipiscium viviparus]|uniref:ABC transporter substrate-binding protein n=1 Tax=Candidatus Epulonipiscium viviparus TaxID=420336 RepID=UPI0027380CFA|nr:extracellular solute-binding protein [Candidatus Epulopiscium viviparus]